MTAGVIVQCDGTPADRPGMALERCRAFLPTPALSPDEARHVYGRPAGWTSRWDPATWPAPSKLQDLCPACARTPEATP